MVQVNLVSVNCRREEWRLEDVTLVVDRMPDGYSVGEVEVMVGRRGREAARARVAEVAASLAFLPQEEGKVEHCLGLQNPGAFKLLQQLRNKN